MNTSIIKVCMVASPIGSLGRKLFSRHKKNLITKYGIDAIITNGDISSDNGKGISKHSILSFKEEGFVAITTGAQMWQDPNSISLLDQYPYLLRPANLPASFPGVGMLFFSCKGFTIGIINLIGRVFMSPLAQCPLHVAAQLLKEAQSITPILLVDFHATATAEKLGLAFFLDGKVTAVIGTHTQVQTNDARILPRGTAFMADVGIIGAYHSVVGYKALEKINTLVTGTSQLVTEHDIEVTPPYVIAGALITLDPLSGKALSIERITIVDHEPI